MSISSANLLWQQRHRGLLPVAHHNLADDGRALVIKPDEFERRTYQLLEVLPDGTVTEAGAISVETVSKFDGLTGGRLVVGMTANDIYVFRESRKARFVADRRVTYTDVHLAPHTGCFACSFADPVFSVYGVAFGDGNGRLAWSRDLTSTPNRVAVTGDGRTIVAGMQDGRILAMDSTRAPLWECVQAEAISALALPASGARPLAGTEDGSVMALDEDGGFRWRSPTGLPVLAIATDADARWAAAAVSDEAIHRVVCFANDGSPVWEYDLDQKPSGISLSGNGQYLLVSSVNGSIALFEVDLTAAAAGLGRSRVHRNLELAREAAEVGDLAAARDFLQSTLDAVPYEVESAQELSRIEADLVTRMRAEAQAHADDGRLLDALSTLDAAQDVAAWDAGLFSARVEMRAHALTSCRERARELESEKHWEPAAAAWLEAIRLDPSDPELRQALLNVRIVEARSLLEIGDQLQSAGDLDAAVTHWQRALALDDTEELRSRLQRVEIERGLAAGIALYEAQRLPEAAFQLRKVLALDPNHEQAQRYLGYTQGQTGDTLIADRFARLE